MAKTAAQLKAEQEQREKQNAEKKESNRQKAVEDQQHQREAAEKAFAQKVLDTWERAAEAASQKDGVRFVVLAEMVLHAPRLPAYMNAVAQAIIGAGYKLTLASVYGGNVVRGRAHPGPQRTPLLRSMGQQGKIDAQLCTDEAGVVGWYDPAAPQIMDAGGGSHHLLLLRWD